MRVEASVLPHSFPGVKLFHGGWAWTTEDPAVQNLPTGRGQESWVAIPPYRMMAYRYLAMRCQATKQCGQGHHLAQAPIVNPCCTCPWWLWGLICSCQNRKQWHCCRLVDKVRTITCSAPRYHVQLWEAWSWHGPTDHGVCVLNFTSSGGWRFGCINCFHYLGSQNRQRGHSSEESLFSQSIGVSVTCFIYIFILQERVFVFLQFGMSQNLSSFVSWEAQFLG